VKASDAIEIIRLARMEAKRNYPTDYASAFDEAVGALEKQVPRKPILKDGETLLHCSYADGTGGYVSQKWQDWVCPVCGWFVGQRYNKHRNGGKPHPHDQRKSDWCNECGQKIDWEK
jgi:hypothetical protein